MSKLRIFLRCLFFCAIAALALYTVSCSGGTNTIPVSSVSLDHSTVTLVVGATEQLTASVEPADADDSSVSWSTSDTAIATVDSFGLVTAVAVGSAIVTVTTTDGEKIDTCNVTVDSTHSISGTITSGGTGLSGVKVTAGTVYAMTNSSGSYSITGLANGSYTVTPTKAGYTFTPSNRSTTISGTNITGVNFTGALTNVTYSLDGDWTRSDNALVLTFSGTSAVFKSISSGYWSWALGDGFVSIGSTKIMYISSTSSNSWSCEELWCKYNTTTGHVTEVAWQSVSTISISSDGNTITVGGNNPWTAGYSSSTYTRN